MRRKGFSLGELVICIVLVVFLTGIATACYRGVSQKSPGDRQADAMERIADAQERQAKSLESIERWVWEPDPEKRDKILEERVGHK